MDAQDVCEGNMFPTYCLPFTEVGNIYGEKCNFGTSTKIYHLNKPKIYIGTKKSTSKNVIIKMFLIYVFSDFYLAYIC